MLAELAECEAQATNRKEEGYDLAAKMRVCALANIEWAQFVRPRALVESAWFKTLTIRQVDALLFSLTAKPGEKIFRDISRGIGATLLSSTENSITIANNVTPGQMVMLFH